MPSDLYNKLSSICIENGSEDGAKTEAGDMTRTKFLRFMWETF